MLRGQNLRKIQSLGPDIPGGYSAQTLTPEIPQRHAERGLASLPWQVVPIELSMRESLSIGCRFFSVVVFPTAGRHMKQ